MDEIGDGRPVAPEASKMSRAAIVAIIVGAIAVVAVIAVAFVLIGGNARPGGESASDPGSSASASASGSSAAFSPSASASASSASSASSSPSTSSTSAASASSSASASAASPAAASSSQVAQLMGDYIDTRPISDDHGHFTEFRFSDDPDGGGNTALLGIAWAPGRYDLDGNEVEIDGGEIAFTVRVALAQTSGGWTFDPTETLTDGISWNVPGTFTDSGVELAQGSWTIGDDETGAEVQVDTLTLRRA